VVEETIARILERQAHFIEGVNAALKPPIVANQQCESQPVPIRRRWRQCLLVMRIRWATEALGRIETIVKLIHEDDPEAARIVDQTIPNRVAELRVFRVFGNYCQPVPAMLT